MSTNLTCFAFVNGEIFSFKVRIFFKVKFSCKLSRVKYFFDDNGGEKLLITVNSLKFPYFAKKEKAYIVIVSCK